MASIIQTFVTTLTKPLHMFQQLKEEGPEAGISHSIYYVLTMGVVAGLITAIQGQFGPVPMIANEPMPKALVWASILIVPLVSLIGSFIGSFVVWILVTGAVFGSMAQYKSIYRVLAVLSTFSPISAILGIIPVAGTWLGIALNIYALVLMIRGVIIVMETKPVRTAVTLGVVFAILFVLGLVARQISDQQMAGIPSDFGDMGAFGDDFGSMSDAELDRELEALANQAKSGAKTAR
jgi:hypothetical protein